MMRSLRLDLWLGALAALLALTSAATPAHAQDVVDAMIPGCTELQRDEAGKNDTTDESMAEARVRYDRGRQLYADGAFEQALLEFERAYQLAPAYRILYNIAQVAMILNDHPKAICAFEAYLTQGNVEPERTSQVEAELGKLRGRVAYLTIQANVEGAEITLDDLDLGKSPLEKPVMVNAGRHRVRAKRSGLIGDETSVTLAGQDRATVALELRQPASGETQNIVVPTPPAPGTPQPPPPKPETSYVWIGWVVTGSLTAAAVATGLATLDASSSLGELRETPGVTRAALDDQQSKARTLGIVTDVLAASAIVSGGVTLYFQIAESMEGESVTATVSPTGIGLKGRF